MKKKLAHILENGLLNILCCEFFVQVGAVVHQKVGAELPRFQIWFLP